MPVGRRFFILSLASMIAVLSTPAHARRRIRFYGRGITGGTKRYGEGVLTADELKACLSHEREINRVADMLDGRESALAAEASQLEQLGAQIDGRRLSVNTYKTEEVDAFNRLIDAHRAQVASYNSKLPSFNNDVRTFNARISDFNSQCSGKKYYQDDYDSALKKLGES